jgi:hypothetical protein
MLRGAKALVAAAPERPATTRNKWGISNENSFNRGHCPFGRALDVRSDPVLVKATLCRYKAAHVRQIFILGAIAVLVASCAAPAEVVRIGPDRYLLNVGAMGIEGGEAGARNKAATAAAKYCATLGQQLNVTKLDSRGPSDVLGMSAAGSASVEFQCIPK